MILDNNAERNNLVREHCAMIGQLQTMYDAIGISRGIDGARVAQDELQAMRERIMQHATEHGITQAEIDQHRNRSRVRAVSVSDAIKKLAGM
jgi:hypothetical protein